MSLHIDLQQVLSILIIKQGDVLSYYGDVTGTNQLKKLRKEGNDTIVSNICGHFDACDYVRDYGPYYAMCTSCIDGKYELGYLYYLIGTFSIASCIAWILVLYLSFCHAKPVVSGVLLALFVLGPNT